MQIQEALLVEGTSKFEILCYGIFRPSDLDLMSIALGVGSDSAESKAHIFFEDEWANCVFLIEVAIEDRENLQNAISKAFSLMFQSGHCLAALCIYDGGFGGYDEIFSSTIADQTYAFCFSKSHHVINFDADLLSSNEWVLIIDRCRHRLDLASRNSGSS